MSTTFDVHQLKNEARFVADDPWHQNRRDTFTLDYYVYTVPGTTVRPNTRPWGYYRHGIRAELSGVEQDLPDSLYFTWRAGRAPAESLPRLLHELQPTLKGGKTGDYGIGLSNKAFTVVVWIFLVWIALAAAIWIYAVISIGMPLALAIPFAAVFPLIAGRIFYRAVYRVWRRRMDQTKWILSRVYVGRDGVG
jgi:hypothetical protein